MNIVREENMTQHNQKKIIDVQGTKIYLDKLPQEIEIQVEKQPRIAFSKDHNSKYIMRMTNQGVIAYVKEEKNQRKLTPFEIEDMSEKLWNTFNKMRSIGAINLSTKHWAALQLFSTNTIKTKTTQIIKSSAHNYARNILSEYHTSAHPSFETESMENFSTEHNYSQNHLEKGIPASSAKTLKTTLAQNSVPLYETTSDQKILPAVSREA